MRPDLLKVKVVALDCDGVMLNSLKANITYYNKILSHLGLPGLIPEDIPHIHTLTATGAVRYLLRHHPHMLEEAERFRVSLNYREFTQLLEPEPGLRRFLEFAKDRFKTAIATNRADSMPHVLEYFGLGKYFDLVVTARDVKEPKPAPDQLLAIIKHFSIGPEELLYVGDSLLDLTPAKEIGAIFVAYKNPELVAHLHVSSFAEIKEILSSSY